ncbi:hypothetical protein [Rhodoferax sp. TS-BS-61-7]|uniref:hypothetical protein n=1 Tax=Rhodoferax sp. TS-BS-61-7 TaxID=2094194 RepID=UPI0011B013B9|nr:hypothetical protein [Rhodoferax sp. TS-BS-61-7]
MIRISCLPAILCAGPRRWLLASLLGTLMACAGVPALANADDGYTARLVTEFAPWVGSPQDTERLVQSLQSGQALDPSGAASGVPATGALGYGETRLALKLAQATLAQEGVTQPSGAQIQAALHGGTLDTANGPKALPGVLPQRAQGVSWGAMAQSAGMSVEDLIPPKSAAPKRAAVRKSAKAKKKVAGKQAVKTGAKTATKKAATPRKTVTKKTTK